MSSNNKETFQWNEKLVEDLATSMYPEEFRQTIINHIAKFKLFKLPAPEGKGEGWEIVKWNHYVTGGISTVGSLHDKDPVSIYSVRRESDGEVFSIGDEIKYKLNEEYTGCIESFEIIGRLVFVNGNPYKFRILLSDITRIPAPPKHILFTTSDGKAVYEGDETLWRVFITPHCYEMWRPYNMVRPDAPIKGEVYFSTEAAANEYVKWHKPGFSLYEIVNNSEMKGLSDETKGDVLYQFRLPKLIELAKSKIDKP